MFYSPDSDLSTVSNYAAFEQLGPGVYLCVKDEIHSATGLCDKSLRVYYLQNLSLRHDACWVHT